MNLKQIGVDPLYPSHPRSFDIFFVAGANSRIHNRNLIQAVLSARADALSLTIPLLPVTE